ncbi:MAG: type II CAAX endopeptidase family protein [Kibdelosporangium sp.]
MRNKAVSVVGLAVIGLSALWLVFTGHTGIRYSADHGGTVPMWQRWIPALIGIVLVRLVPARPAPVEPGAGIRRESSVLAAAAVLFTVLLAWIGGEPAHTILKLVLLVGVPVAIRYRSGTRWTSGRGFWPVVPVLGWIAAASLLTPAGDYASTVDAVMLVAVIALVFVLNSVVEEFFYRRWLQTRWEALLGRWPAIVLASLLWASWHIGIQSAGRLDIDLASVFVNQGVQGLFLGYLWSEYRMMWPLLVVHGAMNVLPILV